MVVVREGHFDITRGDRGSKIKNLHRLGDGYSASERGQGGHRGQGRVRGDGCAESARPVGGGSEPQAEAPQRIPLADPAEGRALTVGPEIDKTNVHIGAEIKDEHRRGTRGKVVGSGRVADPIVGSGGGIAKRWHEAAIDEVGGNITGIGKGIRPRVVHGPW